MTTEHGRSAWRGELNIDFACHDHKTIIASSFQRSPLKIQQPLYPEKNGVCHTVVHHTAGGMVGGDILTQNFTLGPHCQSFVTTPAAAKIYKTNGAIAQQHTHIHIADGACLEFFPQETIVFNHAVYQQSYYLHLGHQAHYCGWELTRFGRTARGETFEQGDWKSSFEVQHQGKLIWIDRQWLPGGNHLHQSLNGLNHRSIYGNFYWFGASVEANCLTQSRHLAQNLVTQGQTGVTELNQGMVCRYQGPSTTEAKKWFLAVWGLLREVYLNRTPITPRVWQL
jgi:urease accessory protein